ncbi:unnamed protein product [Lactuca saligna]|uniref:Uncharacterized protein n=1 Tax=Lactuca saligna TaxID=75948 RepID=A0AA35ZQB3_LACSI|nr:unnamed protein product [Lactuca saligna]
MAPSTSSAASTGIPTPKESLGFVATALKRKDSFIQFFAMTGILLLSMRSRKIQSPIGSITSRAASSLKPPSIPPAPSPPGSAFSLATTIDMPQWKRLIVVLTCYKPLVLRMLLCLQGDDNIIMVNMYYF